MKQQLTEALAEWQKFDDIYDDWELGRLPVETYREATLVIHDHLHPLVGAARLVERLLPGVCDHDAQSTLSNMCPTCLNTGQVWDEEIVEVVAKALDRFERGDGFGTSQTRALLEMYGDKARAVLSAIAQLAEKGAE